MESRDESATTLRSPGHRRLVLAAALVPVAMIGVVLALEPDARGYGTHEQLGLPACGAREWFGIPCPACGCTTAVTRLWSGDGFGAFMTQPFGFFLGLLLPALAAWVLWIHVRGGDAAQRLGRIRADRWGWTLLVIGGLAWAWKLAAGSQ